MNVVSEKSALHVCFDAFELDEREARPRRNGQALPLQPKALAVLCALARQPGRLVPKSDLLDAVWGHRFVTDSVLKSVISDLRAALGDDARQPRFIETAVPRLPAYRHYLGGRRGGVMRAVLFGWLSEQCCHLI